MSDFLAAGLIVLALAAVMNVGTESNGLGCQPGNRSIVQIC